MDASLDQKAHNAALGGRDERQWFGQNQWQYALVFLLPAAAWLSALKVLYAWRGVRLSRTSSARRAGWFRSI